MRAACAALALVAVLSLGCEADDPFVAVPPDALSDSEVAAAFAVLESGDVEAIATTTSDILARGDFRFVPVLIDLLRLTDLGIEESGAHNERVIALERLSGQRLGADWFAWVGWYAQSGIEPPPGYAAFKGRTLARIDPEFVRFVGDRPSTIGLAEVLWGGSGVDAARTLDLPTRVPADEAPLDEHEPVLAVSVGGEAVAYPLRVLGWHEIVNDRVGDVPVLVAYCGLCGSAGAFQRGERSFGVSGLVYRGGWLMYDAGSDSLWSELTGAALVGPAVAEGEILPRLPARVTRFGDWREAHPDGAVLGVDPRNMPYAGGDPYGRYSLTVESSFPVPLLADPDVLAPKTRVFVVERGEASKAWPLPLLLESGVLEDELGGEGIVLVATRGALRGHDPRKDVPFPAGAEVRAFRTQGDEGFAPGPDADTLRDAAGVLWTVGFDGLESENGVRPREAGALAYWFAWHAVRPDTPLYEEPVKLGDFFERPADRAR